MVHHPGRQDFVLVDQVVVRHAIVAFDHSHFGITDRDQLPHIAGTIAINQGDVIAIQTQRALCLFVVLESRVLAIRL